MTRNSLIPAPDLFLEPVAKRSARRALLRLLTQNPNRLVTFAEIQDEAGHPITPGAVSNAAASLRRDIAVRTRRGHGGGYVLLVPVRTDDEPYCYSCAKYTALGHCRELDRETDEFEWCWGYERG